MGQQGDRPAPPGRTALVRWMIDPFFALAAIVIATALTLFACHVDKGRTVTVRVYYPQEVQQ